MASHHERILSTVPNDVRDPAFILDERRRAALAEVDNAKFSWFHIRVITVAGVGFFTNAYGIFAINIVSTMLGFVYGNGINEVLKTKKLSTNQDLGVKIATPIGTFFGQLLFGWLADIVGRKRMYGIELVIIIIGTFGQSLAGSAESVNLINVIIVYRFILGLGIGGDYPLSAVISSEFASTRIRGRMMTAVFAAQGWGTFGAALVAFIITVSYKGTILSESSNTSLTHPPALDTMWRLLIGLGCVPGAVALYFRLTIPETPRFTMDIERNLYQASQDIKIVLNNGMPVNDRDAIVQRVNVPKASWSDFVNHFGKWNNAKVLLGTSWSWFVLDITFYGLGLNNDIILEAIEPTKLFDNKFRAIYEDLINVCRGNIILSAGGLIPGYYFTFFFIDVWGRKRIQLMGFTMLTILFLIMGFGYDKLTDPDSGSAKKGFVVFFCLANFFQNFGPNTTTFIIPGEVFPTRYRSTGHGISAASGKLGAILAQVIFAELITRREVMDQQKGIKIILIIFAFFMLTGILSTLLLPETKNKSLEELSGEDQEGFVQGYAAPRTSVAGNAMEHIPMMEPYR